MMREDRGSIPRAGNTFFGNSARSAALIKATKDARRQYVFGNQLQIYLILGVFGEA